MHSLICPIFQPLYLECRSSIDARYARSHTLKQHDENDEGSLLCCVLFSCYCTLTLLLLIFSRQLTVVL